MGLTDFFPKKELSKEEELKREYDKKFKKIKKKLFKKPMELMSFVEEAEKLMDEAIKDGVYTEEKKAKQMKRFSDGIDKVGRYSEKIRKGLGR